MTRFSRIDLPTCELTALSFLDPACAP
jgi:hypothetical protein